MKDAVSFFLARPIAVLAFFVSLVIFGILSLFDLKITTLPEIGFPKILIETKYPYAGIEETESLVSRPIAERLGSSRGVKAVYTISEPGVSKITVTFVDNRNLDFKILELREKLEQVREALPQNVEKPVLTRYDPNSGSFLEIAVFPDKLNDPILLRSKVEEDWKPILERVEGVASLQIGGGYEREVLAKVDSRRMLSFKLSPQNVGRSVVQSNRNVPAGSVPSGDKEVLVRVRGAAENLQDLSETVVFVGQDGEPVRLKDFASLSYEYRKKSEKAIYNGKECVILYFFLESGGNPVEVSKKVRKQAEEILNFSRSELKFEMGFDESDYIKKAVAGLRTSLIIGALLAFIVCALVLRNFSTPLIILIIVPVSVIASFFLFRLAGLSLNMMSLGGLAVGIGMLFDNSNVILSAAERIYEKYKDRKRAAEEAVSETGVSVVIATISTLFVFVPMAFLDSFIGSLFSEMAIAISLSLLVSLIVALSLTPTLYLLIPRIYAANGTRAYTAFLKAEEIESWILRRHSEILKNFIARPKLLFAILIGLVLLSLASLFIVKKEILPAMETGEFAVTLNFSPGTIRERMEDSTLGFETYVKEQIPIERTVIRIGKEIEASGSASLGSEAVSEIRFILDSSYRTKTAKYVERLRKSIISEFPNIDAKIRYSGDILTSLIGENSEIRLELRGENFSELEVWGEKIVQQSQSIKSILSSKHTLSEKIRSYSLKADEAKMLRYGWSNDSLAEYLRIATLGGYFSGLEISGKEVPIRLVFREEDVQNATSLLSFTIPSGDKLVPIGELVQLDKESGYRYLYGIGSQRANIISIIPESGKKDTATKELLDQLEKIPSSLSLSSANQEDYSEVSSELGFSILLAYVVLFLLIAGQFESLRVSTLILVTVPIVVFGSVVALVVTFNSLNASSFVGLILLMGISVDSGVLFYEYYHSFHNKKRTSEESAITAASTIVRAVIMNSSTTIAGLLPVMFGLIPGSEFQASMAIVVGFGLVLSVLNSLFVLPTFFVITSSRKNAFKN
ncbi:efflux RND transporter permease subunit [Leptospira koniambonensis]|uniref:efflux RND transporter permease subunit n=1 Tax=Leptospira koniambonensis TaxID=2484950 RepID=UPI003EC105E5